MQRHHQITLTRGRIGIGAPGHGIEFAQHAGVQIALAFFFTQVTGQSKNRGRVEESDVAVAWLQLGVLGVQRGFETAFQQRVHAFASTGAITVLLGVTVQCADQVDQLRGVSTCIEQSDELLAQFFLTFLRAAAISILELAQVLAFDEGHGLPNRDRGVVVGPDREAKQQCKESREFHAKSQSRKTEKTTKSFDQIINLSWLCPVL